MLIEWVGKTEENTHVTKCRLENLTLQSTIRIILEVLLSDSPGHLVCGIIIISYASR